MTPILKYEITEMDLCAHLFTVRLEFDAGEARTLRFRLPAWIPGSYMIRDFSRNIIEINAVDAHGSLQLTQIDKQTWECSPFEGKVILSYQIYAFDLSVRSAYLDDSRAYFNGTCLFLVPLGFVSCGWQLLLNRPSHSSAKSWQVASTLPARNVDDSGFGLYAGEAYASLIDFPVEIGIQARGDFAVSGVVHHIAVSDGGCFDMPRICADLPSICAEHAAMFGDLPINRYLFMVLATDDGYGGLEHLDSTSLVCKRADLPRIGLESPDKGYQQFLGLCSHEYFHLWNVKRIRPQKLADADLSCEVHTELLWAFEGITSYYDDLALVRSGVIQPADYLALFAAIVTRIMRGAGRDLQSVAASSFDAWTKFYKQDENAANAIVSYYAKGSLIAFGLDVTLRIESDGQVSLDDLMRRLWTRYGKAGIGVPERQIEHEVAEMLGHPLDGFFARFVYGTDELPLDEWFTALGIGFRLRPSTGEDDNGACAEEPPKMPPQPAFGARVEATSEGLRVRQVGTASAAQRAGLSPGDILLAVNDERVTAANLAGLFERHVGQSLNVHYFRRGRLRTTLVSIGSAPADTCDLWLQHDELMGESVRQRRAAWLQSNQNG